MKYLFVLLLIISFNCQLGSQPLGTKSTINVFAVTEYPKAYLISGVKQKSNDTIYFVSIKDTTKKCLNKEAISIGKSYDFYIKDVDEPNKQNQPTIPPNIDVKIGQVYIHREGRDGNTITTTQFYSFNTSGLCFTY
jgi:hypothetical protein